MRKLSVLVMLWLATVSAQADVTLHGIFNDHMVLQRDMPVAVFGKADPGETVVVSFAGQAKTAKAGPDGKWLVRLAAMKEETIAETLTVTGKNTLVVKDVVVGDVWICGGGSNMGSLYASCHRNDSRDDLDYPLVRHIGAGGGSAPHHRFDVKSGWTPCNHISSCMFSAVGLYFGLKVHRETAVPIGLIECASGSGIEAWIAPVGLPSVPEFTLCGIKGVIWYQGESNAGDGDLYFHKMQALIGGWRKAWNIGDFPFYFVQLPNYQKPNDNPEGGDGWARIRMAQFKALSIPKTGMAVAIDLANPDNPGNGELKNKWDVGERLALWALAMDYGMKDLVYSGPLYKEMKIKGDTIRLVFDNVGTGLVATTRKSDGSMVKDPSGNLQRFAIAGEDRKWVWANAVIKGSMVVVSSPEVSKPVAVRYAYSNNPAGCNLYNNEGLPASPFRTDDW